MSRQEEGPSCETRLWIHHDEEDCLFSSHEKQNFSSFQALKRSSNDKSVPIQSKPLIQRVPSLLRENKDLQKYFEPRVVAIGPLHHGNDRLQRAEEAKLKLAVQFAEEHGVSEKVLYKKIKKEIGDLKKCYKPEDIEKYDDEELAWMFFVDGCAVLHAIHYVKERKEKELKVKVDLLVFAQVDLFMLENQLPSRVLELLMSSVNKTVLKQSIEHFIDDKIKKTIAGGEFVEQDPQERTTHDHLLGLLWKRLLAGPRATSKYKTRKTGDISSGESEAAVPHKTFRSVNELKEAGIHVYPSKTSSLRDVSFSAQCTSGRCSTLFLGTLKIPKIVVDDSTGSKFMNLVAYEMCPDFVNESEVTTYLCFLDTLIDTAQDVKVLRHSGMLLNYMGSDEEVAQLFNTITKDLVPDMGTYGQVMQDICKHCDSSWRTSMAKFYYTHFSTPWSVVGFLGAILGLLFTAIQAYYQWRRSQEKNSG